MDALLTLRAENLGNKTYIEDSFVHHLYAGSARKTFLAMQSVGALKELVEKGLVIEFELVSDNGQTLHIKQPLGAIVHSFELPFEAVRQIGINALELQMAVDRLGFGLTDCHLGNWVNFEGAFRFVDFGSFIEKSKSKDWHFAELEFRQTFLAPLLLFSRKNGFLARVLLGTTQLSFLGTSDQVKLYAGPVMRKILRLVPPSKYVLVANLLYGLGNPINEEFVASYAEKSRLVSILSNFYLKKVRLVVNYFSRRRVARYSRILHRFNFQRGLGQTWSDYGTNFDKSDYRSKAIFNKVLEIHPKSIVDIGGNVGNFAKMILGSSRQVGKYLVLDGDNDSLNIGMSQIQDTRLQFVYFNFSSPTIDSNLMGYVPRFKSDLVLALAVTHHILLTDGLGLDLMWGRLSDLTNSDLLIEFMPKGLWVPGAKEFVPTWYSQDTFLDGMSKYFNVQSVENLGENRILIHGIKINLE